MIQLNPRAWSALLLLALAATASPVRADFNAAVAAYDRGDFPAAADQFERLARLGNPRAQYNLGLMLAQGEGRPRDLQSAYNWLEAARLNGDTDGEQVLGQLRQRKALDPAVASRHAARHVAISAEQLRPPQLFSKAETEADAAALRPIEIVFPDRVREEGQLGVVWTLLLIGEDGLSADAWPVFSVPTESFDDALEEAFRRGRFAPATLGGRGVTSLSATRFRFGHPTSASFNLSRHLPAVRLIGELREQANAGNIASQSLLGIVLSAYRELANDAEESGRWLESAGRGGSVDAIFLSGFLRATNAKDVLAWRSGVGHLLRAGIAGHVQAQLFVALELARDPDGAVQARALDWLAAAAPVEPRAALYLSAELLSSPHESLRDPPRARSIMQPLIEAASERRNPFLWEVAAALSAMDGRLPEAVERQTRALRLRGETPGKGDSLSQLRLRAYSTGRLWTDRLLPVPQRYAAANLKSTRGCLERAGSGSRLARCE
jgi:TPR repeat protein